MGYTNEEELPTTIYCFNSKMQTKSNEQTQLAFLVGTNVA